MAKIMCRYFKLNGYYLVTNNIYIGTTCNYRLEKHDPLYEFNQKKRQQSTNPLKKKAANIATAHKLLVIIYALSKNNQEYNS